jgi:hypothetical protein
MKTSPARPPRFHLVLVAAYFLIGGALGMKIFTHEQATSGLIKRIATDEDLDHVTNMDVNLNPGRMGFVTSFLLKIAGKNFTNHATAEAAQRDILDRIEQLKHQVFTSTVLSAALVAVTLLFLAASRWWPGAGPPRPERQIYDLLAVSLLFFAIGISCPVMTAAVKGEHMLIGGFVIETDSKGILSTVASLFQSGNWVISALLAGFSIGIPIFKGVGILATVAQPSAARRARVGRVLEAIGKWSLTDVLVAAVLLGVFSLNAIKNADGGVSAVPRLALGFFIAYCVLAAVTSSLLRRSARDPAPLRLSPRRWAAAAAALALALAAGLAAGRYGSLPLPAAEKVEDAAVIKLVRTHQELLNAKFKAGPGHPAVVGFVVPFAATLTVDLRVSAGPPLLVSIEPDDGRPAGAAPPLRAFPAEAAGAYRHAAAVDAGKYRVWVRPGPAVPADSSPRGFALHLSVDP